MPVRDASVFGPSWHEIEHGRPRRAEPWWRDERERLLALAAQGTPAYVYHLPTLRERARSLLDVEAIDRRYFAIKANPHQALLRALVAEGFGLECVSLGELEHVFSVLPDLRSEEHTSELQSLMRISYAVFCLKKKNLTQEKHT